MNVNLGRKPVATLKGFNGLYARGAFDACPPDHLTDCNNCQFTTGQVTLRDPVTIQSTTMFSLPVLSYFIAEVTGGPRLLTLNNGGALVDETTSTLLITIVGSTDFFAINVFGRCYITFKINGYPVNPGFVYYYDGTNFAAAAGLAPASAPVLAQVNPGIVGPGVHTVAVSYQYRNGNLTPPSPIATINSTGTNDIEVSSIPIGGLGVVGRVLLMSQANQTELFFVPGGTIPNNTATTATINVFDTSLIASADYLNDLYQTLPSCSSIRFYQGRLIYIGAHTNPDIALVSNVDDPETVNQVTGTINVPMSYGFNTTNTGLVINGVLYLLKPGATYSTQDNGGDPNTWPVTIIDSALGAWDNGVSVFASALSAQDTLDSSLIVTRRGLMLFTGTYSSTPLSYKIDNLWSLIDLPQFQNCQIAHDVWNKKVYIAVPLAPPTFVANGFVTSPFLLTVLMMDYKEGLSPESVKWSTWTSALFGTGITKMLVLNFTLSYASAQIYQLTFSAGDGYIYKIIRPQNELNQGIPPPYIPDQGVTVHNINQYIISPLIRAPGDGIWCWTMLNFIIYGYGDLYISVLNKNKFLLFTVSFYKLQNYSAVDVQRVINLMDESFLLMLGCDPTIPAGNNGFFQPISIDVYANKMFNMRPALTQTS